MSTLHRIPPVVESDAAFRLRMAHEDQCECDRIAATYPVGAARLFRAARTLIGVARSIDSGYSTEREYERALDDLEFACDEMEPVRAAPAPAVASASAPAEPTAEWDLAAAFEVRSEESMALPPVVGGAPDTEDGMEIPRKEHSLADRRRWQHQSNLAEMWHGSSVE